MSLPTIPDEVPYDYSSQGTVQRIIDGNSFFLADSQQVRLLGINTPELSDNDTFNQFYAYKAQELLGNLIFSKKVMLTFDGPTKDIYGRLLAYVWLLDDDDNVTLFIQAELLKAGLARIKDYPRGKLYYDLFYNLRRTAMKNNLGIWSR